MSRTDISSHPPSGGWQWCNRWLQVRRVTSAEARHVHLAWMILGASLALPPIVLHHDVLRFGFACVFQRVIRLPCAFCGYTRAFIALGHGDWQVAFSLAPLSLALYGLAWSILLVNLGAMVLRLRVQPGTLWRGRLMLRFMWTVAIGLLAIDWGYRILVAVAG